MIVGMCIASWGAVPRILLVGPPAGGVARRRKLRVQVPASARRRGRGVHR